MFVPPSNPRSRTWQLVRWAFLLLLLVVICLSSSWSEQGAHFVVWLRVGAVLLTIVAALFLIAALRSYQHQKADSPFADSANVPKDLPVLWGATRSDGQGD